MIIIIISTILKISNYLVEKTFTKVHKKENKKIKKENKYTKQIRLWYEYNKKDIYFNSFDNIKIHSTIIEDNNTDIIAIIVHGYGSSSYSMKHFAYHFYNMGISSLLIDLRSYGESEGNICSLGYYEQYDVLKAIEYINNNYKNKKIILLGTSMGASTVLLLSNKLLDNNIKLIVADSPFSSIKEILSYRLLKTYFLPAFPFVNIASIITKKRFDFSFDDANINNNIKNSNLPILFIHSKNDKVVPIKMCYNLYKLCNSKKDILIFDKAKHIQSIHIYEEKYLSKLKSFIEENI